MGKKVKDSAQYRKMKIAEAKKKAAAVKNESKEVQESEPIIRMTIGEAKEKVIDMLDQSYYDRIKGVLSKSQWKSAIERAAIGDALVNTAINAFNKEPDNAKMNLKDWYLNILRILHNLMIAKKIDSHTQMLSYILMDDVILSADDRIMEANRLLS